MYFVNWQRQVSIEEQNGKKVVVKRNKSTKDFHEFILVATYVLISILLGHPSPPPSFGSAMLKNEGQGMRNFLKQLGIPTPPLMEISESILVEEFIGGGNLYGVFSDGKKTELAFEAGRLTGKLHRAGYVFTDNKAQNYLVSTDLLIRTDLAFITKTSSVFSRSMDIGSFLASVMDIESHNYQAIEIAFFKGYKSEMKRGFPYLSIILRNILSSGFTSNQYRMTRNMLFDSSKLISI